MSLIFEKKFPAPFTTPPNTAFPATGESKKLKVGKIVRHLRKPKNIGTVATYKHSIIYIGSILWTVYYMQLHYTCNS